MKNYILLFIFAAMFFVSSCNKKNETESSTDDIKKKELELKEKELKLKEEELMRKREENVSKKEQEIDKKSNTKTDLNGKYYGSIKDGTSWEVTITGFNGKNFSGYNVVYWKSAPEGFRTSFTGDYDESTGSVTMYEDKKAKGSGTFYGNLSSDGKTMSGNWTRYTDGGSFTWNLTKSN